MTESLKGNERYFHAGQFPFTQSILDNEIQDQLHFVIPTEYMQQYPRTMDCYSKKNDVAYQTTAHMSLFFFIVEAIQNTVKYRGDNKGRDYQEDGYVPRFQILMSYITKEVWDEQFNPLPAQKLLHPDNTVAYMFSVILLDDQLRIEDALADQIDINFHGPPKLRKKKPNENGEKEELRLPPLDPNGVTRPLNITTGPYKFPRQKDGTYQPNPIGNRNDPRNYHKFIRNTGLYADFLFACTNAFDEQLTKLLSRKGYRVNLIPQDSDVHHTRAFSLSNAMLKFRELGAHELFCCESEWHKSPSDGIGSRFGCPAPSIGTTVLYDFEDFTVQHLLEDKLPHTHILDKHLLLNTKKKQSVIIGEGTHALDLESLMNSIGLLPSNDAYIKEDEDKVSKDIFNDAFDKLSAVRRALLAKYRNNRYEYSKALVELRKQGLQLYNTQLDLNNKQLPIAYRKMLSAYYKQYYNVQMSVEHLWHGGEHRLTPFAQFRVNDITFLKNGRTSSSTLMLLPKLRRAADSVYIPASEINTNKENISLISGPGAGKSVALMQLQKERIHKTFIEKSGGSAQGLVGSPTTERLLEIHQEANQVLAPVKEPVGAELNTLLRKLTQIGEGRDIYETTRKNPITKEREAVRYESPYTNVVIAAHNARPVPKGGDSAIAAMYNRFAQEFVQPCDEEERLRLVHAVLHSDERFDSDEDVSRERAHMLQMAIMDYWGCVAYNGVPMPDISLFSDIAPRALMYLHSIRKEIISQLRELNRMKIRMYCEVVRFAARMALFSVIGLNGENPSVYDRNAVVIEMSKYAYATMDMVVFVVSEALMTAINGNMYLATLEIIKADSNYVPLGCGPEGEDLRNVKQFPPTPSAELIASEPHNMQHRVGDISPDYYSLEQTIRYAIRNGQNYLTLPEYSSTTRNGSTEKPLPRIFDLKEVAVDAEYQEIFHIIANKCPVEPLVERAKDVEYKLEYFENKAYINLNYIKIQGTIADYSKMFNSTVLSEEMMRDMLYKLRSRMMAVPYIPVLPRKKGQKEMYSRIHSLRYSKTAISMFKKFKVPVLISDVPQRCFYILAAFVENRPQDLIESAIKQMCFESTRPINCLLGIPSLKHPDYYAPIEIRPTKRPYTRNSQTHVSKVEREIYTTVMGNTSVQEIVEDPTNEDLEEYYARRYLKENFPKEPHLWIEKTPSGIERALFGPGGYYTYRSDLIEDSYPEGLLKTPVTVQIIENEVMGNSFENRQAVRRKEPDIADYQLTSKRMKIFPGSRQSVGLPEDTFSFLSQQT